MSKRFYYDEFCEEIFDEEIQTYPSNQSICGILNKQAQRIAELEEQLKNAIVLPKYEKGQPIYYICNNRVIEAYFQRFNVDIDADNTKTTTIPIKISGKVESMLGTIASYTILPFAS
mgnify:CR=1 FL=1